MNATQSGINGQTTLSDDQRRAMLESLSPENQQLVAEFIEAISDKPTAKQADSVEDVERKMLLARFKQLEPDDRAELLAELRTEAESAAGWQGQGDTPTEPLETAKTAEFEAVRTIARHVVAKLITGEFGAKIFDAENGFSTLECVYLDVREAIASALPLTDAAELKAASVYFSVR